MKASIALIVLALCLRGSPTLAGSNGTIVMYRMDVSPDGTVGEAVVPSCGGLFTPIWGGIASKTAFGVFARLSGAATAGISSAELYISGLESSSDLPSGWSKSVTYPPEATVIGSLHDVSMVGQETVRRGIIAWPVSGPENANCQTTETVLLAVVEIQSPVGAPTFPLQDHRLTIVGGNPPSDPGLSCPVLRLCDSPVFTGLCLDGGEFNLNPSSGGVGHPGEIGEPFPLDGATNVPRDVQLRWTWFPGDDCTPTAWMSIVDFGADPEQLQRHFEPPYCGELRKCFAPMLLSARTTYYWRAGGGYVSSPLWSFTTGDVLAVDQSTWGQVKQLYR